MGDIITNLSPSTTIAGIAKWMPDMFAELWPWAMVGVGIILCGFLVNWIISVIIWSAMIIFNKDDAGQASDWRPSSLIFRNKEK